MIKLNNKIIDLKHFPDNTLLMKLEIWVEETNKIEWKYEDDSELFALYCLKRKIDSDYNTKYNTLSMPYIPHARQDRVKRAEDVFTLKYFAEIINSMNFDRVEVLDPHSPVSEALINRMVVNTCENYVEKIIGHIYSNNRYEPPILYYPDNGAYKKYSDFLKYKSCYGIKERNWEDGKIIGLSIALNGVDIKDKPILMVDDIISYGSSMYHSAKKLKELGCGDIYIFASHVENSILEGDLINSGLIKQIYTTDSIFTEEHPLIKVFN